MVIILFRDGIVKRHKEKESGMDISNAVLPLIYMRAPLIFLHLRINGTYFTNTILYSPSELLYNVSIRR